MHWIDWSILAAFSVFIVAVAFGTKKYSRSVADFLAASRCGGRYILAMSDGMAALGAVSMVMLFQMYYNSGFTVFWWQSVTMPAALLVGVLGWVIYRFRQTRAFTFGQFFEIRYSRRFRLFAGVLAWVAGIINFGVFPSVGARFFIYFCDLPQTLPILGMDISTYGLVMAFLILLAVGFTFIGGQIAVMVTDFIQAAFCNMIFILILVLLYVHFNWNEIAEAIAKAPPGKSMVNPYDIGDQENYNTFYYLIAIFLAFYGAYSWQGQQGYNNSARNAHEAKMSKVVGFYRWPAQLFFIMVLSICAYTLMNHGNFTDQAHATNSALSTIISAEGEQIGSQMTVPLALKHVLPVGVMGAFCAVMFAAFISTHDTYLHAWGSIFIQDVILPLRKKPLTPKQHIRYLRWSILGVAAFIFCFSYFYVQKMDIAMFFALSGAIFVGGAGAAIIGGLYWKRGTTAGAWTAMIIGSTMGILGFVLTQCWTDIAGFIQWVWPTAKDYTPGLNSKKFIFTGQEIGFFAGVVSIVGYVLVSLLGRREVFNLDRMLHRGKYATDKDPQAADEPVAKIGWKGTLGFDKHFTLGDKIIYVVSYVTMFLFLVGAIVGSVCNWMFDGISDAFWLSFWHSFIAVFGVVTVVIILWLTIGGFFDLKKLFVLLRKVKRNDADDGTVIDHHNLDEE